MSEVLDCGRLLVACCNLQCQEHEVSDSNSSVQAGDIAKARRGFEHVPLQPSVPSRSAIAKPMPAVLPVMTATLPSKRLHRPDAALLLCERSSLCPLMPSEANALKRRCCKRQSTQEPRCTIKRPVCRTAQDKARQGGQSSPC